MQKVYLLLRNNQQTGPYTFEELLALHLKPYDLIWVEGKSYGWRYPAEVESLKPYVAAPDSPPPQKNERNEGIAQQMPSAPEPHLAKTVFVSMPVNGSPRPETTSKPIDIIEQKAEELRKRAQAYIPQEEQPVRTNYTRDLNEAEEDYTKWIYQKKTKKKSIVNKKTIGIAIVSLLVLSGGWWISKQFAAGPSRITQQQVLPQNTTEETIPESPSEIETANSNIPPYTSSSTTRTIAQKEDLKAGITNRKKVTGKEERVVLNAPAQNDRVETTTAATAATKEKQEETVAETPIENKKTLKEKLGDLFRRKKIDEASETTAPAANGDERKATHREEENVNPPVMVDVSNEVDVKTNKLADSWMLGVKGLKLTLYNRSNLTINTAKVEVLYFSDQDILLDRKVLSYSNIAPKKSQAVSAPDHRMADHIQFKVLSATGIENAYANK